MNSSIKSISKCEVMGRLATLLIAAVVGLGSTTTVLADKPPKVVPPTSMKYGGYAELSAAEVKWALEFPLAGHPAIDSPDFDISAGQTGDIWFLGGPFGTVERTCTIPENKALFITLANAEVSSLEPPESGFHGDTEAEQRELAKYYADHIVTTSLRCTVDGEPVKDLERYRVSSPQFEFTAPTPWIFGETGGYGTSVGDGYYVLIEPLPIGQHTIHFEGLFRFTLAEDGFDAELPIDMTYHLTVE